MCNTDMLKAKIDACGYKLKFVAEQCHLSYQGFLNKMQNKHDFLASEMAILRKLLNLTDEEFNAIFFGS